MQSVLLAIAVSMSAIAPRQRLLLAAPINAVNVNTEASATQALVRSSFGHVDKYDFVTGHCVCRVGWQGELCESAVSDN